MQVTFILVWSVYFWNDCLICMPWKGNLWRTQAVIAIRLFCKRQHVGGQQLTSRQFYNWLQIFCLGFRSRMRLYCQTCKHIIHCISQFFFLPWCWIQTWKLHLLLWTSCSSWVHWHFLECNNFFLIPRHENDSAGCQWALVCSTANHTF